METPVTEPAQKQEHKAIIYNQSYHQTNIKILEFDYQDSEQGGVSYKLPQNWKKQLETQLESTSGSIAPEYCMPDLYNHVFKDPIFGPLSVAVSQSLGITNFFSFISKTAGLQGRKLLATDIANRAIYGFVELASARKIDIEKILRESSPNTTEALGLKKYDYKYGEINPGEYQLHTSNDARHLVTARGLMQYVLGEESHKEILSIWTPKHAERIADYISRQNMWEKGSTIKVEGAQDFKYVSPTGETKKMVFYGRPPLMRSLREYQPILSPIAYEIDLLANQDVLDINKLELKITKYLDIRPQNKSENKYQSFVREASKNLQRSKNAQILLNTDKIGWEQIKNDYIY